MLKYSHFVWILFIAQNLFAGPGCSKCLKNLTTEQPFYNQPQYDTAKSAASDAKKVNEERAPESPRSSTRCNAQTCQNGKHAHFDGVTRAKAQVAAKQVQG